MMPDDWPSRYAAESLAKVDVYIAAHPEYTRRGVKQPAQGATNRVIYARRDGVLVVFKVFCEVERKERECFALRHWRETGLVPKLIWDADPRMVVTSYLPGVSLPAAREAYGETAWGEACLAAGRAAALLLRVPLGTAERAAFESRFYDGLGALEAYLGRMLELGHSIHRRDPGFRGRFWRESLDLIEGQLGSILAQPRALYHQDPGNLHVEQGRFAGFFDLEMCRVGGAAMQLASSLGMLEGRQEGWTRFCAGWEVATGTPLSSGDRMAALAASHLLHWREISRYLSYDGTPGSGYAWASPADPAACRRSLEKTEGMLGIDGG
jgi:hypothetical protein